MRLAVMILGTCLTVVPLAGQDVPLARTGSAPASAETGTADCNENGVDDAIDIADGTSEDCDGNAVPDECDVALTFTAFVVSSPFAQRVTAGDADQDGDEDAFFMVPGGVRWTENLGGGSWGSSQVVSDLAPCLDAGLHVADLDGDEVPDLLWGQASGIECDIRWSRGDGNGTFTHQEVVSGFVPYMEDMLAVDFDLDGDVDVVVSQDSRLVWHENAGGEFGNAKLLRNQPSVSIDSGDLDGDGDVDLVVTDSLMFWLERVNGQDTFLDPQPIGTAQDQPVRIELADLDLDGDLDVLAASPTELFWYDNLDGAAQFGVAVPIGAAVLSIPWLIGAGDLDGDGDPDVLANTDDAQGDGRLSAFENLGGFPPAFGPATALHEKADFVVAELNGDAYPDILLAEIDGGGAWLRNDGRDCDDNGIPDACEPSCLPPGGPPRCDGDCNANGEPDSCDIESGTSGDCDGDGLPDECERDCNANAIPDECEITAGVPDCNDNLIPDECEADCNLNGVPDDCDLASGGSEDCNTNLVPDECDWDCNGNGIPNDCDVASGVSQDCNDNGFPDECEGTIGVSVDCNQDLIPDECQPLQPDCDGDGVADGCDVSIHGDCNGNGVPDNCDILFDFSEDCSPDGIPDECQPDCDGDLVPDTCELFTFEGQVVSDQIPAARDARIADVDGDGDPDLLSASWIGSRIAWYENLDGQGSFGPQLLISAEAAGAQSVVAADLDGDGDPDVLSASAADDKVAWYENLDGAGSFGPQRVVTTEAFFARRAVAADLDGDDDLDVLTASEDDDEIAWHENLDGAGTFGAQQVLTDTAEDARAVFAADLDGDGDQDVLAASAADDEVAWYENLDGAGTFGPAQVLSATADGATDVYAVDLDGDGDLDVLSAAELGPEVAWYENLDGAGTFGPPNVVSTSEAGARSVRAADVDADGDLDIVVAAAAANAVVWYSNEGGGSFDPARIVAGGFAPQTVDGAQVDGLPGVDLVVALSGSGELVLYRNANLDCNGNGVPDVCDPDCDADGTPDTCELALGAPDCNGNEVPDDCETVCGTCDLDGDACADELDADPADPFVCSDIDLDGCDDCSSGSFAPSADGVDGDGDGRCGVGDCDDGNATVWKSPGPVGSLRVTRSGTSAVLTWTPPSAPGSSTVRYDVLRLPNPWSIGGATCVDDDGEDTVASDPNVPFPGVVSSYLPRAVNDCPDGAGSLGSDSEGVARTGPACP